MWRKLFPFIPIIWCFQAQASPLKPHPVYDFSKGLDTYHSSLSLPDGFVHASVNVLFDSQAPVTKRQGFTVAFTTTAAPGQTAWVYTDSTNTTWIIERTSAAIVANNLSGSASVLIATVSANNLVGEVNALGNAYFVDQTQGVYYWNGTATTFVSGSPKGSLIAQWHGRVWVSGLAVPNGNLLYGSKQYDGTVWATGLNPNDPVILTVGLQDNFDSISALYPYLDTFYVFKHSLTYAVYGFDQTNFQISFITSECGCIDQQSIQTYGSSLKFVSQRGVETFDGYTCTRISDAVKNLVDPAIQSQGGVNSLSWVQSTQADWNAGTLTPSTNLSVTLASPALVLNISSHTDSATADFNLGSGTNTLISGNTISIAGSNVPNNGFETSPLTGTWDVGGTGPCAGWASITSVGGAPYCTPIVTPSVGSRFADSCFADAFPRVRTGTLQASIWDSSDVGLSTMTASVGDGSWNSNTFDTTGSVGKYVKLRFYLTNSGDSNYSFLKTTSLFLLGGNITFDAAKSCNGSSQFFLIDNVKGATGAAYQSAVFNAAPVTLPTYFIGQAGTSPSDNSISMVIKKSNSPSGPWTDLGVSTGTSSLVSGGTYFMYVATWTAIPSGTNAASLNSFIFTATSTGSFKSQIHNTGSVVSWGNFTVVDSLNGGSIAFTLCTSTNSNMSVPTSCLAQTPNTQILVSTGTYVQWYATFTVTAATQTPTLNSGTIQWFSGNRSAPMSSTVWDNRYWLSLTTTTADSFDDAVLVLNTKGAWSLYDIHAGGLVQYKGSLYHTDSASTGNVYLDNQGYADNGSAINAFIQTKDYCEEGPTQEDYYESIYPSMDNLGNYSMSVSYVLDRSTSSYSLSSVLQSEFSNDTAIKLPFPDSQQNFGKCIDFTFTESDLNSPWNFYGASWYFHERAVE